MRWARSRQDRDRPPGRLAGLRRSGPALGLSSGGEWLRTPFAVETIQRTRIGAACQPAGLAANHASERRNIGINRAQVNAEPPARRPACGKWLRIDQAAGCRFVTS